MLVRKGLFLIFIFFSSLFFFLITESRSASRPMHSHLHSHSSRGHNTCLGVSSRIKGQSHDQGSVGSLRTPPPELIITYNLDLTLTGGGRDGPATVSSSVSVSDRGRGDLIPSPTNPISMSSSATRLTRSSIFRLKFA